MRAVRILLTTALLLLLVLAAFILARWPGVADSRIGAATTNPASTGPAPLRIGLIPERDIFKQRAAYRALADYLSGKLGRPVELATVNSYQGVLKDFAEKQVDMAFLGSLVAVLTVDRLGAEVLLKPEYEGGISTYHSVVFVRDDSPIKTADDLAGRSLGAVHTTTGGNLYPFLLMMEKGMLEGPKRPRVTWIGTHDDVIAEVVAGRVEAGAVKNLRLDAYLKAHPDIKLRLLGRSNEVPENALIVRKEVAGELSSKLREVLFGMERDTEGQKVLATLGMTRFLPCRIEDYETIYAIVDRLGPAWRELDIAGPAPQRPGRRVN